MNKFCLWLFISGLLYIWINDFLSNQKIKNKIKLKVEDVFIENTVDYVERHFHCTNGDEIRNSIKQANLLEVKDDLY